MRRGSLIGPMILIFLGLVFLLHNVRPDIRLMDWLETWWPALLIVWGVVRLLEIGVWYVRESSIPQRGITGGEWVLILVLVLIGTAVWGTQRLIRDHWGPVQFGMDEMFGENHDYDVPPSNIETDKAPHVIIDMARGNVRVTGTDGTGVKVGGRKSIRALDQAAADKANADSQLNVQKNGETITVSAHTDGVSDRARVSTDLEVSVPRGATLELRGQYGDFDVSDVAGEVSVNSDNAGVRAQNLDGRLRVETRKSDIIRATGIKGDVEVKGRGRDIELEDVQGQVTINGSFSGETMLRNVAKPVRFESSVTQLRMEKVPGELTVGLSTLVGENLSGHVFVKTQTKYIRLTDVTESLTIDGQSGDVEVNQTRGAMPRIDLRLRSGDVELALPSTPKCTLDISTNHGGITNDFLDDSRVKLDENDRNARLAATLGGPTEVKVAVERGNVTLRKSVPGVPEPPAVPAPATPKALKAPKAPHAPQAAPQKQFN